MRSEENEEIGCWALSSVWLERFLDMEEVRGSSPLLPTMSHLRHRNITICFHQKKTVDAAMNSIRGSIVFSIPDVAKNLALFYGQPTYNEFNINLDVWK